MDRIIKLEAAHFANSSIQITEKEISVYQPLHWHDFYEIEFILDGGGEYIINGTALPIRPGALFFSTPTDIQEIIFSRKTHLINLSFTSEYIDDLLISPTLSAYSIDAADSISDLLTCYLSDPLKTPVQNRTLYFKSLLSALLILIMEKGTPVSSNQAHIASHKNLRDVIFYINRHFQEPLDLTVLAKAANLTPKYLSKRFMELSGIPLSRYLQEVRLHYARNLVLSTTIPLKQVCARSGFSTAAHFSRCFRQKYGCSPSQMRRDRM